VQKADPQGHWPGRRALQAPAVSDLGEIPGEFLPMKKWIYYFTEVRSCMTYRGGKARKKRKVPPRRNQTWRGDRSVKSRTSSGPHSRTALAHCASHTFNSFSIPRKPGRCPRVQPPRKPLAASTAPSNTFVAPLRSKFVGHHWTSVSSSRSGLLTAAFAPPVPQSDKSSQPSANSYFLSDIRRPFRSQHTPWRRELPS